VIVTCSRETGAAVLETGVVVKGEEKEEAVVEIGAVAAVATEEVVEEEDKIFHPRNLTSDDCRVQQLTSQQLMYVTAKKIEAQEDAEGSYER
jgi:hypothetical protein